MGLYKKLLDESNNHDLNYLLYKHACDLADLENNPTPEIVNDNYDSIDKEGWYLKSKMQPQWYHWYYLYKHKCWDRYEVVGFADTRAFNRPTHIPECRDSYEETATGEFEFIIE